MREGMGGDVGGPIDHHIDQNENADRLVALLVRLRLESPDLYEAVIFIVRSLVYKT